MQTQNIRTVVIGIMVTLVVPFVLVGCGKPKSEKPAGGYPGGQKAGAVNNAAPPDYAAGSNRRGVPSGGPSGSGNPGGQ